MSLSLLNPKHKEEDFSLDPKLVAQLWKMEDRHFWHRARNHWIVGALKAHGLTPGQSFLDVGCGSGAVSAALAKSGLAVTGVDTAETLVRKASERVPKARFLCATVESLPPAYQGPYDGVGAFDVLEHLDQPREFLKASLNWVRPGALVIATVPALQALFSITDSVAGHKIRYERGELKSLFESVGLEQCREFGIFQLVLPLIWLRRISLRRLQSAELTVERRHQLAFDDLSVPPAPLNRALDLACALERGMGWGRCENQIGSALLAVGRVPR